MSRAKQLIEPSESEIADAVRALREVGFSHADLLYIAARDWVHSTHLKNTLDEAIDKATKLSEEQRAVIYLEVLNAARGQIGRELKNIAGEVVAAYQQGQRRRGGEARHKQTSEVKALMRREYDQWRATGSPYTSANHFATAMESRHGAVKARTIAQWCTHWKKETMQ